MSRKPKTINPETVDPSIYYYDEDYDEMKNEEKEEARTSKDEAKSKGSRYIKGLIETANERKTEKEVRKFKRYAKDREEVHAQGEIDGTEVFITQAYKKKLDEIKKIESIKEQKLQLEEDRKLNIYRSTKYEHDRPSSSKSNRVEIDKSEGEQTEDTYHTTQEFKPIKHPKTYEERKEYLGEKLAKRTVGPVFEAAVVRYRQRTKT